MSVAARVAIGVTWALLGASPLSLAQTPPPRKIIREIRIQGLVRESEADLKAKMSIQLGDVYDPRKVSLETGSLYATRKFRKVAPPIVTEFENSVSITFVVYERSSVLSVEFKGRRAIREGVFKGLIETRVGTLYNDVQVRIDADSLLDKYREEGYIMAQVRPDVSETAEGAAVSFVIDEGTRVRIAEVRFTGNRSVASSTLIGLMSSRKHAFFTPTNFLETFSLGLGALYNKGYYSRETLEADISTLRTYYYRLGFFDARVEIEDVSLDTSKQNMVISIGIEEGPQYTFRGYDIPPNLVFDATALLRLTKAIDGQPFSAETVRADQEEIQNFYGDRAYIDARVTAKPIPSFEGHDVRVKFEIEEGTEAFIESVKVENNIRTRDEVILRELEFYPGERFDRSRLQKSRSNLNRLQFLTNIDYDITPGSSPSQKAVTVKVEEEQQSGRLIIGFGVTSGFGIIGNFGILKKNFDVTDWPESIYDIQDSFTGAGQTLNLQAQPGSRRSLYRFSLTEPYLFGTRNSLRISASMLTFFWDRYRERRATFDPRISHAFDFDRDFSIYVGSRIEEVEIYRVENGAPQAAKDVEGFTTLIALNTGVTYDRRLFEYLEGYYDGFIHNVEYEYGGGILGGEVDFHKVGASNEVYYPIYVHGSGPNTLHHVFSVANRFGWIETQHSVDSIPIFERFFLGGANTVRGFQFRELGPHEGREPVGGTAMLYGNVEYSFPIFLKLLRGVVFFDYGNLAPELTDFSLSEMRYSAGGGLRINFPFLGGPIPIGLYLGAPLKKEDEDRKRTFLFTIGAPF